MVSITTWDYFLPTEQSEQVDIISMGLLKFDEFSISIVQIIEKSISYMNIRFKKYTEEEE